MPTATPRTLKTLGDSSSSFMAPVVPPPEVHPNKTHCSDDDFETKPLLRMHQEGGDDDDDDDIHHRSRHHPSSSNQHSATTTTVIRSRKSHHSELRTSSHHSHSSSSSHSPDGCCSRLRYANSSTHSNHHHSSVPSSLTTSTFTNLCRSENTPTTSRSHGRWYMKYSYPILLFLLLIILLQCIHIMLPYSSFCSTSTDGNQTPLLSSSSSSAPSIFCPRVQPSIVQQQQRPFPKWGRTVDVEEQNGIVFRHIRNFIVSQFSSSTTSSVAVEPKVLLDHTKASMTQLFHLPELLYIIHPSQTTTSTTSTTTDHIQPPQLYMSQTHRLLHMQGNNDNVIVSKLNNTERIMIHAIQKVLHTQIMQLVSSPPTVLFTTQQRKKSNNHDEGNGDICQYSTWPTLCTMLYSSEIRRGTSNKENQATGFPFLAWYGDYTGCNYQDYVEEDTKSNNNNNKPQPVSIPSFTVAADVHCNHTFPFPNYYLVKSCMKDSAQWDHVMDLYRTIYPFDTKISQVVWRGSLTGKIFNTQSKCPRWHMVEAVRAIDTQRQQNHTTSAIRPSLFDVKITKLSNKVQQYHDALLQDIGHEYYGGKEINFLDFQKYRSILDIDGHSWSGRFGSLLCFNSIVLKVDPRYVDYYYAKREPSYGPMYRAGNTPRPPHVSNPLQAWKHYIPIRDDFSNLEEMAEFVLDRQNDEIVQRIIQNANDWCRTNMIEDVIAYDMLTIWDRYVQLLNIHDRNWSRDYTDTILRHNTTSGSASSSSSSILRDGGALQMMALHGSDYAPYVNNAVVPKQSNK